MFDTHTRTQTWLADLAEINAEIALHGLPSAAPRKVRRRKLKLLWEE